MKRSGFKPRVPPARPSRQWVGPVPTSRAPSVSVHDGKARAVVTMPKLHAVRSRALREAYRLIPCQFERDDGSVCEREDGTVCCCHSNYASDGKGMARKADDSKAAAGCREHHYELDQGKNWDRTEKRRQFYAAYARSVRLLVERGLWPEGIPLPIAP